MDGTGCWVTVNSRSRQVTSAVTSAEAELQRAEETLERLQARSDVSMCPMGTGDPMERNGKALGIYRLWAYG